MQTVKAALVAAIAIVALVVSLLPGLAEESGSLALTISIDGAIGPASASYVKDALAMAGERRAEIVILRLNTPGSTPVCARSSRMCSLHPFLSSVTSLPPERMRRAPAPTFSMRPISL